MHQASGRATLCGHEQSVIFKGVPSLANRRDDSLIWFKASVGLIVCILVAGGASGMRWNIGPVNDVIWPTIDLPWLPGASVDPLHESVDRRLRESGSVPLTLVHNQLI